MESIGGKVQRESWTGRKLFEWPIVGHKQEREMARVETKVVVFAPLRNKNVIVWGKGRLEAYQAEIPFQITQRKGEWDILGISGRSNRV